MDPPGTLHGLSLPHVCFCRLLISLLLPLPACHCPPATARLPLPACLFPPASPRLPLALLEAKLEETACTRRLQPCVTEAATNHV